MNNTYWELKLKGSKAVLKQLCISSEQRLDWQIIASNEGWKLRLLEPVSDEEYRIDDFINNAEGAKMEWQNQVQLAKERANTIINFLNSILLMTNSSHVNIHFDHLISYIDLLSASKNQRLNERAFFVSSNANVIENEDYQLDANMVEKINRLLDVCNSSDNASEMIMYVHQYGMDNWVNMYKIYEQLAKKVGRENILLTTLSIPKTQKDRFTRTANNPAASGDLARHAVLDHPPPADPMTLEEGREFLKTLLISYFSLNTHDPGCANATAH